MGLLTPKMFESKLSNGPLSNLCGLDKFLQCTCTGISEYFIIQIFKNVYISGMISPTWIPWAIVRLME